VEKGELLYEGKAKRIYATDRPDRYVVEFKDDATAFNGAKKGTIAGKGQINNRMSARIFEILEREGIRTHFIEQLSKRRMLVRAVRIIPLEVVVRNIVAGSLAKRLGREEGTPLPEPVVEFYYKNDALGDPLVNCGHIRALGLATPEQQAHLRETALKVNTVLRAYLARRGLDLVDFKLEFGTVPESGEILLADEISPDTCRLWDSATKDRLDKDRFRRDLGGVEQAYTEVLRRVLEE